MSQERILDEIVTKFLLDTCRLRPHLTGPAAQAAAWCAMVATEHPVDDAETDLIPLTTGSVAEFYIEPMLPLVGDVDVMLHRSDQLAIPQGHPPPTQLPAEFSDNVKAFEIVDSHLPGYVYLQLHYLLSECNEYENNLYLSNRKAGDVSDVHGPALCVDPGPKFVVSVDFVYCRRCLSWPPQAADWPTRHRNYGWPDSATVDRVVSNGCDVVRVAHRQCRQDEWMGKHQQRLSFSRAEVVLLNSWMPVQQIVYHMLRVFVKTEQLTESRNKSKILSNYHIKTLMMWACELKSSSFWTDDLRLIRTCTDLLHTLSVWLTDALCPHYFINNCNLTDYCWTREKIAIQLLGSIDEAWLSEWFVNHYIRTCSLRCPDRVSTLLTDVSTYTKLQNAVSAIVNWRPNSALEDALHVLQLVEFVTAGTVSVRGLTVRSCVCWMTELPKTYTPLAYYFTAVAFLHVAYKISETGFTDELIDVLATLAGQYRPTSSRRHRSQCSSELSLSQATKLMKVVANSSRSTMHISAIIVHNRQQPTLSASDLNTSELVELLQRSAVEHLTTYRQLEARDFGGSVATIATTYFEALYAYKHGDYQRCLQLSTQNVHTLLYAVRISMVWILPEFVQLLDDDIVSLTALTLIVNPECRDQPGNVGVTQLTLSLYLMTQCQLKLRHSVTSLAQTLDYIEVAQRRHPADWTLNHLTLNLTKHLLLLYISK